MNTKNFSVRCPETQEDIEFRVLSRPIASPSRSSWDHVKYCCTAALHGMCPFGKSPTGYVDKCSLTIGELESAHRASYLRELVGHWTEPESLKTASLADFENKFDEFIALEKTTYTVKEALLTGFLFLLRSKLRIRFTPGALKDRNLQMEIYLDGSQSVIDYEKRYPPLPEGVIAETMAENADNARLHDRIYDVLKVTKG